MPEEPQTEPEEPVILRPLGTLLDRARRGDPDVMPELRRVLDAQPEIWQTCGDLASHARTAWIELAAGDNLVARESLTRQVAAQEAELAGPSPSPLERLLVERVVACWLQVHHADAMVAQMRDVTLKQAKFAQERQDRAHRRYLQAIGALAMLRKLLPSSTPVEPARSSRSTQDVITADTDDADRRRPAARCSVS